MEMTKWKVSHALLSDFSRVCYSRGRTVAQGSWKIRIFSEKNNEYILVNSKSDTKIINLAL